MDAALTVAPVRDGRDLLRIEALFRAYAAALDFDLGAQDFAAELLGLPGRYAPPRGTLLLAQDGAGGAVGCVGVRPLEGETCEAKRLYVRPAGRGTGAGRVLMEAALAFAAGAGYRAMRLDTLPTMEAAIALYTALGFAPVPPPADDAGLGQIYFVKDLAARRGACGGPAQATGRAPSHEKAREPP